MELIGRIFINKRNHQYTICPIKKNLSKEVRALMDDPNIVGFKLQIVEQLKEMPKPNTVVDWRDDEAVRLHRNKCSRDLCRRRKIKQNDKV